MADEARGQNGHPRLHRCLLQSSSSALVRRLPQSDGLRTATRCQNRGSITGLSTESGQLHILLRGGSGRDLEVLDGSREGVFLGSQFLKRLEEGSDADVLMRPLVPE